jgi:hypothetical protein
MTNRLKLLAMTAMLSAGLFAQQTVPSTTLCGSVTYNATSICLSSTTNVINQTGFYIDGEFMVANITPNQTLAATNAYVPVSRANRAGRPPTVHNNGAVVWIALTPNLATPPGGDNGFQYTTNLTDVGPCTLANISYLPHIWPDLGLMRTCGSVNATGIGQWVNYTSAQNTAPLYNPLQLLTTNGALPVTAGNYLITKAGVLADTLAAPTAGSQDGIIISISSTTANAHTLTATGLFQTGTASVNLATFAAQAGAGLTLMSYNGKWIVLYSVGITFS